MKLEGFLLLPQFVAAGALGDGVVLEVLLSLSLSLSLSCVFLFVGDFLALPLAGVEAALLLALDFEGVATLLIS